MGGSANRAARDGTHYGSMMTSSKPRRWPELAMIAEALGSLAGEDRPIQLTSLDTRRTHQAPFIAHGEVLVRAAAIDSPGTFR